MGIYIPNMQMPVGNEVVYIFSDGTVEKHILALREVLETGKAVPVPPHERLLKVLKTERECVSRDCNRDCGKCDLSLEQDEVLSAYNTLITLFADPAEEWEENNQREYEMAVETAQYCELYEPTYDPETGAL